ncbi:hypothetical protein K7432_006014 [Basidiobolus ranarum]|uniref:Transmembrane protein n=1 Tax=Basidiobolus ranarum TaxID=34480 RepID=A0ABR2W378_9FUNG
MEHPPSNSSGLVFIFGAFGILFVGLLVVKLCVSNQAKEQVVPNNQRSATTGQKDNEMVSSPPPYAEAIDIPPSAYFAPTYDSHHDHSYTHSHDHCHSYSHTHDHGHVDSHCSSGTN